MPCTRGKVYSNPPLPPSSSNTIAGVGKRHLLLQEMGAGTMGVMRAVKHALDAGNLLNPGKVLPDMGEQEGEQEGQGQEGQGKQE